MEFWKWFSRGILRLPKATPRAMISPLGEYFLAIVLGIILTVIVLDFFTKYWLLLVIPLFSIMASHGYWRAWVKNN